MSVSKLFPFWFSIPSLVRHFLIKAFLLFLLWKIIYHLFLFPYHIPDHVLTRITAANTAALFSFIFPASLSYIHEEMVNGFSVFSLFIDRTRVVRIHDACNGLELFVLYLGFLFCIPVPLTRFVSFVLIGITSIFILNVLRCFGLAWLYLHHYSIADFAHHYLFKMVIYFMVFGLWIAYSKKYFNNAEKTVDSCN